MEENHEKSPNAAELRRKENSNNLFHVLKPWKVSEPHTKSFLPAYIVVLPYGF